MSGWVGRFISFEKLIAGPLIKVLYWIGIVGIIIYSIVFLFGMIGSGVGMMDYRGSQGMMMILGGLIGAPIMFVVMILYWRFLCEIMIIIFRIYDRLGEVRDALTGTTPRPSAE